MSYMGSLLSHWAAHCSTALCYHELNRNLYIYLADIGYTRMKL